MIDLTTQLTADHLEIAALLDTYGRAMDTRDWETFEECFTDDALTEYSWGTFRNRVELRAAIIGVIEAFATTQHMITNQCIDINGDRATGRANLWVICIAAQDAPGVHLTEGGTYATRYTRTADGWRIAALTLNLTWAINGEPL